MSQLEATPTTQTHLSRVARAASLVMAFFIVSRALGLLREMIIARQFGTGAEMDAYIAAFRLPDFLFYVVAGGALGSAFIPIFTGYLTRRDLPGAWRLASAVINWVVLVLSILGLLAAWLAPWLVERFLPAFTPAQQTLTVELMRWMLISTVIFGVSGVAMGILNARQHFLLPALAPIVYNGSIILGALFLGPTWGVRGLAAGVVVGALGHLLIQLPGLVRHKMAYRPVLAWRDADLRAVGRLMAPRVLGLMAVQINFIVTIFLAATLPTGSATALNYGWIIMLLPQGIIAQSVATALFPTLAALAAQDDLAQMRRVFDMTLRNVLFLTLPAAAGLLMLPVPIIRLILEWGKFDEQSTQLTAWALAFFALGLVGHAVVEITTRAFYALKNTKTPVAIAVAAMGLNVLLSFWLMDVFARMAWPPHAGLALANAIAITLEMIVLLILLRPEMGGLTEANIWPALGKMSAATGGMVLVLWGVMPGVPPSISWLPGIVGIITGGVVYGGIAYLLGADELLMVQRRIVGRFLK